MESTSGDSHRLEQHEQEGAAPSRPGRRQWLIATSGAIALSGLVVRSRADDTSSAGSRLNPATLPMRPEPHRFEFFTPVEMAFIDAAIARLIPSDELGPGALEAGVTLFIDHQLAGPYGSAADWYMTGPWEKGTKEQGYQRMRTPAQVYRAAILALDAHTRQTSGKPFAALAGAEQDDLLHALEDGSLDLGDDVSAKTFFTLLWQNTQEGFFADPIYLGNKNFAGWKLIGYPGPRYNYDEAIRRFGQVYPLPVVGLMGRDPSRQPKGPL